MAMGTAKIEWTIDLQFLVSKKVVIETREGHVRAGKLTNVRFANLQVDGYEVGLPDEVELNGEDAIPFNQIVSLKRA